MLKRKPTYVLLSLVMMDLLMLCLYFCVREERFDLDAENNIPSFYQSAKIVLAALVTSVLAYLSVKSRKELIAWGTFAIGFFYLAMDEWFQIHEEISRITDEILLQTVGRVSFSAWIVAYLPVMVLALIAVIIIYQQVVSAKEYQHIRKWFALSALIVFMVPVVEVLGTVAWDFNGPANPTLIALEEGLEMLGISLFVYTFIRVIEIKRH